MERMVLNAMRVPDDERLSTAGVYTRRPWAGPRGSCCDPLPWRAAPRHLRRPRRHLVTCPRSGRRSSAPWSSGLAGATSRTTRTPAPGQDRQGQPRARAPDRGAPTRRGRLGVLVKAQGDRGQLQGNRSGASAPPVNRRMEAQKTTPERGGWVGSGRGRQRFSAA